MREIAQDFIIYFIVSGRDVTSGLEPKGQNDEWHIWKNLNSVNCWQHIFLRNSLTCFSFSYWQVYYIGCQTCRQHLHLEAMMWIHSGVVMIYHRITLNASLSLVPTEFLWPNKYSWGISARQLKYHCTAILHVSMWCRMFVQYTTSITITICQLHLILLSLDCWFHDSSFWTGNFW